MTNDELISEISDASIFGDLVIFTGAGVSLDLRRESNPAKSLPNWRDLLIELTKTQPGLRDQDKKDICSLLFINDSFTPLSENCGVIPCNGKNPTPSGEFLIQAAEILSKYKDIKPSVCDLTKSENNITTNTHKLLENLTPRGYVTFNYDQGHEFVGGRTLEVIVNSELSKMKKLIKTKFNYPFILKAHGCVTKRNSIVLSSSSYQKLLYNNSTYRAIMNFIFNRFLIVSVGFGLSDPDFDAFLITLEKEFGKIPRPPINICKTSSDPFEIGHRISLEKRFGIRFLEVGDYSEIPQILEKIEEKPGKISNAVIKKTLSTDKNIRAAAHREFENLSDHGRKVFKQWLFNEIERVRGRRDWRNIFNYSEFLYSIGKIGSLTDDEVETLKEIVESETHYEPPALALFALQEYYPESLKEDDYKQWLDGLDNRVNDLEMMLESYGFENYVGRHKAYLSTLKAMTKARIAKRD